MGLKELGFEVVSLLPAPRSPGKTFRRIVSNLGVRRHLENQHFDRIVGFDSDGFFMPASLASRYFVCLKGVSADEARFESGGRRLEFRLLSFLERLNARKAHRILVTSQYSREKAIQAHRLDPKRLTIVPEGIDLRPWQLSRARKNRRRKRGSMILSVARQYARKDTSTLLRALPQVRESVPEVQACIVGDGPELSKLKRLCRELEIEKTVEFRGGLDSREAMLEMYQAAEVFCLPSLQEGFGIVFLEAMAAGLPIVAVRAGAVPEILGEEEVGFLVSPSDPQELAVKLVQLLQDDELRMRLGAAGIRKVEAFEISKVSQQFATALELYPNRS